MKIGMGHLRMPPAVFWRCSFVEFMTAMDGYLESKGVTRGAAPTPTRAEADAAFAIPMIEVTAHD